MTPRQLAKRLVDALKGDAATYGNQPSMGVFLVSATISTTYGESALIKIKFSDGIDPSKTFTKNYLLSEVPS